MNRRTYQQPWELYDLVADRSELHNLASADAAKATELQAKWEALPWPVAQ